MADQFVTFPATAGNYVVSLDSNEMDSDSSHIHQGVGRWVKYLGLLGSTPTQSQAVAPSIGDFVMEWPIPDAGWSGVQISANDGSRFPVTAGETYSFGFDIWATLATPDSLGVFIRWYDSGNTNIGTATVASLALAGDGVKVRYHTGGMVAPANAVTVAILLRVPSATGDTIYSDAHMLTVGTDSTFVPSARISGNLVSIKARASFNAWSDPAENIIGKYLTVGDQRSYYFRKEAGTSQLTFPFNTTGAIGGAVVPTSGYLSATVTEGELFTFMGELTLDTGSGWSCQFSLSDDDGASWDAFGVPDTGTPAGSIFLGSADIEVGAIDNGTDRLLAGNVCWAEIIDGDRDGPVVARFDALDVPVA